MSFIDGWADSALRRADRADVRTRQRQTPGSAAVKDAGFMEVAAGVYPRAIKQVRRRSWAWCVIVVVAFLAVVRLVVAMSTPEAPVADPRTGLVSADQLHAYIAEISATAERASMVVMVPFLAVLGFVVWSAQRVRDRLVDRYDQVRQDGMSFEPVAGDWSATVDPLGDLAGLDKRDGRAVWRAAFAHAAPVVAVRAAATRQVAQHAIRAREAGERFSDERTAALELYSRARHRVTDVVVFGRPDGPGPVVYSGTAGPVAVVLLAAMFWVPGLNTPLRSLMASWNAELVLGIGLLLMVGAALGISTLTTRAVAAAEVRRRHRSALTTGRPHPADDPAVAALTGPSW